MVLNFDILWTLFFVDSVKSYISQIGETEHTLFTNRNQLHQHRDQGMDM